MTNMCMKSNQLLHSNNNSLIYIYLNSYIRIKCIKFYFEMYEIICLKLYEFTYRILSILGYGDPCGNMRQVENAEVVIYS